MEKVAALVAERGPAARDPGVLIQCLAVLPSWGEKNFQVLNKVYEVIAALAAGPLSRRDAGIAVEGMAEKIAELKHRYGLKVLVGEKWGDHSYRLPSSHSHGVGPPLQLTLPDSALI